MKIIFIGGVKGSLEFLKTIINQKWKISAVFSYNDSKRKLYSDSVSFDEITTQNNIPHFKVNNINDDENVALIRKISPDLILVLGWSQIIKDEILSIPKIGVIGSHPTELPKYRGRSPIPWTILKGLSESAMTLFYMTPGIDDGDILDQRKFKVTEDDDAESLYEQIIDIGKKMIIDSLPKLKEGTARKIKQDNSKFIEYWKKRSPEDGRIDWSQSAKEINTLVRATTHPYPGAFTYFGVKKITIWKSILKKGNSYNPGEILSINENGLEIGTKKGILKITQFDFDENPVTSTFKHFSINDVGKSFH